MSKRAKLIVFPLILLVFLGQGCSSGEHPSGIPTATSQPTIPVPATTTPTAIILNADLSQTGWFVYICDFENGGDLCLVSPDRQKIVAMGIGKLDYDISSPTWSPDGRTIAFVISQSINAGIYIIDVNCVNKAIGCLANMRKISPDQTGRFIHPDWSPDGKKIAYAYRMDADHSTYIWVMDADGTNPTRLTTMNGCLPNWSPNGNEIAFVSFSKGREGDVFVMNKDGSNIHQLTDLLTDSGTPDWSPDGEWLVVNSTDGKVRFDPAYIPTLIKVRADGSEVIRIGDGWGGVWSPDGEVIAFVNYSDIWFVDADGMHPEKATEISTYEPISWQPNVIVPEP